VVLSWAETETPPIKISGIRPYFLQPQASVGISNSVAFVKAEQLGIVKR
jgi:hypothetical protein